MLRKDFFLAEMERLAQVIARIIGLRLEGKLEEANKLVEESLIKDFELDLPNVINLSDEDFQSLLNDKKYPQQKLNLLSQLLFEESRISKETAKTISILKKVLLVFNSLEKEHHTQSLDNINKRATIEKFIKANNT